VASGALGQPRQADDLLLGRGAHAEVDEIGVGELVTTVSAATRR
jgi:hypothetical protein